MRGARRILLAAFCGVLALPAFGQGGDTPDAHAEGRVGELMGVAALMPITGEAFRALWETPSDTTPTLPSARAVDPGQSVFFGLFAAGFARQNGEVALHCRIEIGLDNGWTQSIVDAPCLEGAFDQPRTNLYLVEGFDLAIPSDMGGNRVTLRAVVRDDLTGSEVPLEVVTWVRGGAEAGEVSE